MIISTTNAIENYSVQRYMGVVNANVVIGTNIISDFIASLSDVFGGHSGTYKEKLSLIYKEVIEEITIKAQTVGANAILGLQIDFDEISGGGKSMFMVSACGTAVSLTKKTVEETKDRYAMFRFLNDIYDYWQKGFLSEEEYNYEKKRIIEDYENCITNEIKIIRETKEKEQAAEREKEEKIEEARKTLGYRPICSEDAIIATTEYQILASNYDSIPYNNNDSMETIVAKFIRINRIPEACKYYIDETGLSTKDATDYVLDIYKKIESIDKDIFDRLLNKLRVLKNRGFMEQAINEYQKYTLTERNIAEQFINKL